MATPEATIARLITYAGRVQGVGFRAMTAELARRHPVTGWVRNLPDGRVELLVEGQEASVEQFLNAVRAHWRNYIEDEQTEQRPPTGTLRGFTIAH
jgi:acylphosphatase